MRVTVPCPGCVHEAVAAGQNPPAGKHFVTGQLDDDGIVHVVCKDGHVGSVIYDSPRYQVLINSAARAFLDGYTNEVVAVLSTALERAYEFYLRVIFRSKGITGELFNEAWKDLAAQSERQFGAFHLLHLLEAKSILELDPQIPKIRNKVIHRGHIASESDALNFAELVFSRIRDIERTLTKTHNTDKISESQAQVEKQKKLLANDASYLVVKMMSVVVEDGSNIGKDPEKFIEIVGAIYHARQKGWEE